MDNEKTLSFMKLLSAVADREPVLLFAVMPLHPRRPGFHSGPCPPTRHPPSFCSRQKLQYHQISELERGGHYGPDPHF